MATTMTVHGGIREIGATKVLVETEHARVLLDCGVPIPKGADLFREPVVERIGHELADRLAVGFAPAIPGMWDPAQLRYGDPLAEPDLRPAACFISHAHIDHDGFIGFLHPEIAVWTHPDTARLHQALRDSGFRWRGNQREAMPMTGPVTVGDITVEIHRVDHDVPGASGFRVTTPDGVLAYTGDINFHRDGAPHSWAFADFARGADMLLVETTLLSFEEVRVPATEDEVFAAIEHEVTTRDQELVLFSLYERDVTRCARLIREARAWGRGVMWPQATARLLRAMGVEDVHQLDLETVHREPAVWLVQTNARVIPELVDLPTEPGMAWLHVQGEPLGPFMPNWQPWIDWLAKLGIEVITLGSSGHAAPEALSLFVDRVAPGCVVPLHGWRPEALECSVPRVVVEHGHAYDLHGRVLKRPDSVTPGQ